MARDLPGYFQCLQPPGECHDGRFETNVTLSFHVLAYTLLNIIPFNSKLFP
jgi:hypothetical protein